MKMEVQMTNARGLLVALPLLFLAACGTTEKTVVVNPPPNSTVVVPADGDAKVVRDRQ
jgi:uncharacterized lipoprotein YajG